MFKTKKEELEYLGLMLTATASNDLSRIDAIVIRILQLKDNIEERSKKWLKDKI